MPISEKIMDQYFNEFLNDEGFAPAINATPVDQETLNFFQGKLPDRLLGYWKEYGFAGFGEGLFWLVNPNDYQEIVDKWLKQTNLWERENFYAVARTAFGELYIRGDKSIKSTIIDPHLNNIIPGEVMNEDFSIEKWDRSIGIFFATKTYKNTDYIDTKEKQLFQRCLKKHGVLEYDEMYTFSPALALGGSADINNVKKVKIFDQLSMLCDLDTPVVLKSVSELFGPL
jgi:hypothetical protein